MPFIHLLSLSLWTPAVFTTWLPRFLGGSSKNTDSILCPGENGALGDFTAARQTGHLVRGQDPVPKSHLRQLSHHGLGWVKAPT